MTFGRRSKQRVKITFNQAMNLLIPYVRRKLFEQAKAITFITVYLLIFLTVILRIPVKEALVVAIGMGLVVSGLAFFMEGLFLGVMPLGETIGVRLPQKSALPVLLLFAFILGVGATFAEPAIGVLKVAGSFVKAWDAPLLFLLLNKRADFLVYAVGFGVGVAVLFGMLRFLYSWSLKPFVFVLTLVLIGLTLWASRDPNLISILGLAWDCGGVTTGPVTVPLVLALGIGISRVVGSARSGTEGFGIVTLASLFPIITVLLLGAALVKTVPQPSTPLTFAGKENRGKAAGLFENKDRLVGYMLQHADPRSQVALFDGDTSRMYRYIESLAADSAAKIRAFGLKNGLFEEWFTSKATDTQREHYLNASPDKGHVLSANRTNGVIDAKALYGVFLKNARIAAQAIIPLCLFLLFFLFVFLREKPGRFDEIGIGLIFALIGMALFNIGIELGLANLGKQVGAALPATFSAIPLQDAQQTIQPFDTSMLQVAIDKEGNWQKFFYFRRNGNLATIPFDSSAYDADAGRYTYTPLRGPLAGTERGFAGLTVLILFAFIMGYGATLAEPALIALGVTVEELTAGTFRKGLLMQSVALGVGLGMVFGIAKIIWNVPLEYLIIPPYFVVLVLTLLSREEFVNIGWDSAGVTTGPITVPLVLAMGLGVGGQMGMVEGFGILAMASVWPILIVLLVGLITTARRRRLYKNPIGELGEGVGA